MKKAFIHNVAYIVGVSSIIVGVFAGSFNTLAAQTFEDVVVFTPGNGTLTVQAAVLGVLPNWSFDYTGVVGDFTLSEASSSVTFDWLPANIPFIIEQTNAIAGGAVSIVCDDTNSGIGTSTNQLVVNLEANEHVTCTFVNQTIVPFPTDSQQCVMTVVSDTNDYVVEKGGLAQVLSFIHPTWDAAIDGATWIWGDDPVVNPREDSTQTFRKGFGFEGSVTRATLKVASDNLHSVILNGSYVGYTDGVSKNFTNTTQDEYDVTDFIKNGDNELSIAVTNQGIDFGPEHNPAGLLYSLEIEGENDVFGCEIPYSSPEFRLPNYGPYCGDGLVNQEWEQCDGGNDCTDYCRFPGVENEIGLVKITLDPQVNTASSSEQSIYIGHQKRPVPSGVWFWANSLLHVDRQPAHGIAWNTKGLGVSRNNGFLDLAFRGNGSNNQFDYVAGTIETMGLDIASVDRVLRSGWKLENLDQLDITDPNTVVFNWELTGSNADGARIELSK